MVSVPSRREPRSQSRSSSEGSISIEDRIESKIPFNVLRTNIRPPSVVYLSLEAPLSARGKKVHHIYILKSNYIDKSSLISGYTLYSSLRNESIYTAVDGRMRAFSTLERTSKKSFSSVEWESNLARDRKLSSMSSLDGRNRGRRIAKKEKFFIIDRNRPAETTK